MFYLYFEFIMLILLLDLEGLNIMKLNKEFLPICKKDLENRNIDQLDFIIIDRKSVV